MTAPAGLLSAAEDLVSAFARHDRDAYFASFSPRATFIFHTTPLMIGSRAEYEQQWTEWEAEGFHVESCQSLGRRIDLVGADVAVMTHRVRTRLQGVAEELHERETIVFQRVAGDTWLAVHEHLSPDPGEQS